VRMYPFSSMITPDPEPDCAWEGVDGIPRVRIVTTDGRTFVTTAGTESTLSCGAVTEELDSATTSEHWTKDIPSRIANPRRNLKPHGKQVAGDFGQQRVIKPRLVKRGHCLITTDWVKDRGDDASCGSPDGGKHLFDFGSF
jgi:hypothetical protein